MPEVDGLANKTERPPKAHGWEPREKRPRVGERKQRASAFSLSKLNGFFAGILMQPNRRSER
eukprot:5504606-Amphidinium_carterae.1